METILNALQQPVLVLDQSFQPLLANPALCQLLEIPTDDREGKGVQFFLDDDACKPSLRKIIEKALAMEPAATGLDFVCTLASGREIELMVIARKARTGTLPLAIIVELHDVTHERETDRRLQELNTALAKHVANVNEINSVIQAYSDSVSHDLRTPLRFVSRIAYLLLNDPALPLTEKTAQQVKLILQATTEMGKLIENLLVFSHVGRTPMKQNTVNIQRLFQEAARESDLATNRQPVTFDIQEMDPCVGDRLLLKEVAINLIGNAIKFTRTQDGPKITVGSTRSGTETVYFVRDNGVGFDMNRYDSLFLPFQRLHKSTDFEGSGIGLALVRRIIERHGGRIWATSEIDQGTTFCFTLGNGTDSGNTSQEKETGT